MTVPELLRRSGQAIREKGWAKFVRHADGVSMHSLDQVVYRKGAVCALGAIEQALWDAKLLNPGESLESSPLGQEAVIAVGEHVAAPVRASGNYHITSWNNANERTAEEVVGTFLAAAACEEGKALAREGSGA